MEELTSTVRQSAEHARTADGLANAARDAAEAVPRVSESCRDHVRRGPVFDDEHAAEGIVTACFATAIGVDNRRGSAEQVIRVLRDAVRIGHLQ